jgi:hypothetical protein
MKLYRITRRGTEKIQHAPIEIPAEDLQRRVDIAYARGREVFVQDDEGEEVARVRLEASGAVTRWVREDHREPTGR